MIMKHFLLFAFVATALAADVPDAKKADVPDAKKLEIRSAEVAAWKSQLKMWQARALALQAQIEADAAARAYQQSLKDAEVECGGAVNPDTLKCEEK
jgi:hypothetical protein